MNMASPPANRPPATVRDLLASDVLGIHFQPIVGLAQADIHGHEALVRPPADSPWPAPDRLFAAARLEGLTIELELACLRQALRRWREQAQPGRLFVNMSASALIAGMGREGLARAVQPEVAGALALSSVVIELTEHEHVHDMPALQDALATLRSAGISLALDDFGDGRSSLRLWSELRPEYVKIDKYFTRQVNTTSHKLQTYRALLQIAETFGAQLVAEGVETEEELRVLRDIGVPMVQGYFLGRPAPRALPALAGAPWTCCAAARSPCCRSNAMPATAP